MATRILGGRWTQPGRNPTRLTSAIRARDSRPRSRASRGRWPTRIDALHAEATQAIGYTANTLRSVRERYRTAYTEELAAGRTLRDELDALERLPPDFRPRLVTADDDRAAIADAAEAGAEDDRARALRADVTELGDDLGRHQTELAKLELACATSRAPGCSSSAATRAS